MRVLMVYPKTPDTFWSFKHVLRIIAKRAAFPPLGLLTVAAMLPREWELVLVDLNVTALREEQILWADYVMVSAMLVQRESVEDVAARCAVLGKPVIAGGPLFTTSHTDFPQIPHFVLGEAEDVMPALVADMSAGTVKECYEAPGRPDLTGVPVPRWDLVEPRNYATMAVQFSRGCPYDCEFCDIVIMNGRVPRTKSPGQLIKELVGLRERGWTGMVFVVDDNFIGDRKRTKALLHELVEWRKSGDTIEGFLTEASLNLAQDPELCALMVEAGFRKVFVGIETPSLESLKECHKLQNQRGDMLDAVKKMQRAGLQVMGGFIVGFDSDQKDIFERQFDFIQRSGVVTAMVGLLTALPQTRLYKRLLEEGRIEVESSGNNTEAALNFTPKLDKGFLESSYRQLMKRLYEPKVYYERIRTFLKEYRPPNSNMGLSERDVWTVFKSFWLLGVQQSGRIGYWRLLGSTMLRSPRLFRHAVELAILGHHFRRVAAAL